MKRRALATISIGLAALLLAGCSWGSFQRFHLLGGYQVTVTKASSNQTIYNCSAAHPGDSTGRANCVLDTVRILCTSQPLPGFPPAECQIATSHAYTDDMKRAISEVLGDGDCLAYQDRVDAAEARYWVAVAVGNRADGTGVVDCP